MTTPESVSGQSEHSTSAQSDSMSIILDKLSAVDPSWDVFVLSSALVQQSPVYI